MAKEQNDISLEEQLARQQQQFEQYKEEQKKGKKKKWFWGCGGCLVFIIIMGIIFAACSATIEIEVDKNGNERNEFADEDIEADKILKVDMTVKNNSGDDIPVGGDVKVYTDGKQAKSYPVDDELLDGLSPGRSIDGSSGFAINGNPEKIELEYEQFLDLSNEKVI